VSSQEGDFQVRLLLFSGKPDPEWYVNGEASRELRERAHTSIGEIQERRPPATSVLGYRGFLVMNIGRISDIPEEFRVYRGVLSQNPGTRAIHWRDMGQVEQFLLREARERGFGEALEAFGAGTEGEGV